MKDDDDPLKVENTSGLTDADWAEINRCKQAYQEGGKAKLSQIMDDLSKQDPIRHMTVVGAFWPDIVREAIRDEMAERGMDEEDLRDLIRKLESPARDQ
jgi:hypothetical protein